MKFQGYNPNKEEVYTVKEDVGPGVHQGEHVTGVHSSMDFRKNADQVMVRYEDKIVEADVYVQGDHISVHWCCPRCKNYSWIKSENKAIEYDAKKGLLSVEPFGCTWEIQEEIIGHKTDGFSLCRLQIAIDKGIAKNA